MKYAYILQGEVMYVEDRDVDISHLVAPDLTDRFVPIPEGVTVKPGMIYSDGAFMENPVKPDDIFAQYQSLLMERNAKYGAACKVLAASATAITDDQALAIAEFFPDWVPDTKYVYGQVISRLGQLYRIKQTELVSVESQPPEAEGMLAVYSPINPSHTGTADDPIPWVYGMDCYAGKYYSYSGKVYKVAVGGDMIPCLWAPDTPDFWQWEEVAE